MEKKLKYTVARSVLDGKMFHKVTLAGERPFEVYLTDADYKVFKKNPRMWLTSIDITLGDL